MGQELEELVKRTESSWKNHKRVCSHREMKLPHGEVVEEKRQVWRRIAIWLLLVREPNIESYRGRTGFGRSAICRLHDAGTTASGDDIITQPIACNQGATPLGCEATKAPRLLVPLRKRSSSVGLQRLRVCIGWSGACAAKHHNGRADCPGTQLLF